MKMKRLIIELCCAIALVACGNSQEPKAGEEDLRAKSLLQGIWIEDETELPLMRIEGDTIYYTDPQNIPVSFKIIRDTITEVMKKDSVVMYKGIRYRGYVYINPSKMKVIRTSYSEDGISVVNVYYDNVIHICVYEGRQMLYGKDITKKMFAGIFPTETLNQMILADMNFMGVNNKGYQYQATLCVPESSVYSLANITIGFDNQMSIKKAE